MNFIFFWRLVREKGFDLIIESLRDFDELPGDFFLFWDGPLRSGLIESFHGNPRLVDASEWSEERVASILLPDARNGQHAIYFFSWRPRATIERFLDISHFALMPSRFLETFGLSALESLCVGIPVIGYKKWGLIPFIDDSLAISSVGSDALQADNLTRTIRTAVETYSQESAWKALSGQSRAIATRYTEDRWMQESRTFLPTGTKKILLVSDYIAALGGIEAHVASIAKTLAKNGYEVETFGWHIPRNRFTRLLRIAWLVVSSYNPLYARKFKKKLTSDRPDFIWFHNVSRFLGPAVVHEGVKTGIPNAITYHEFGVFTPFPSRTEHEDDIPSHWSLSSFLSASRSIGLVTHLAVLAKFIQLSLLRSELKKIGAHIVPSGFMRTYVHGNLGIPEDRIVTLEHFRG